jgi:hypothetical protein
MALAGLEIWRIQIFGRWGSSAVLGYIQDAPVSAGIGIAEMTAKGLSLAQLRKEAAEQLPAAEVIPEWKVKDAVARVLEGAIREAADSNQGMHAGRLRESIAKFMAIDAIDGCMGLPEEAYVQNMSGASKGVVHSIKSTTHTACGWAWATSTSAMLRHEAAEEDHMCARCLLWSLGP